MLSAAAARIIALPASISRPPGLAWDEEIDIIMFQSIITESIVPKTARAETKQKDQLSPEELKTFVENAAKRGTPRNGRRIEFHFVRRKRKAY